MKTLPIYLDSGRRNRANAVTFGIPKTASIESSNHGMACPNCKDGKTRVIDSRATTEGEIRRRRVCIGCSFRFTTVELYRPEFIPDFQI